MSACRLQRKIKVYLCNNKKHTNCTHALHCRHSYAYAKGLWWLMDDEWIKDLMRNRLSSAICCQVITVSCCMTKDKSDAERLCCFQWRTMRNITASSSTFTDSLLSRWPLQHALLLNQSWYLIYITLILNFCDSVNSAAYHIFLSLIHIWRCRRSYACRSRWSPYH